jgi:hypothetical protein
LIVIPSSCPLRTPNADGRTIECAVARAHGVRRIAGPGMANYPCDRCAAEQRVLPGRDPITWTPTLRQILATLRPAARSRLRPGDLVARLLAAFGIRPGAGCGCARRQEALNALWPPRPWWVVGASPGVLPTHLRPHRLARAARLAAPPAIAISRRRKTQRATSNCLPPPGGARPA